MAVECFRQVLVSILDKICRGAAADDDETFRRLPDCIVIDIVSRLPTDTLVRCRRNCRDLRALMSSHYFTTLHVSRARQQPMPLVYDFVVGSTSKMRHKPKKLYVIDKTGKLRYLSHQPVAINNARLSVLFSCQGVVLLINCIVAPNTYYVLNPITQEKVIVQHTHRRGILCALYYCCRDHQFKLLYAQTSKSAGCQYLVYIFKTRTWRKIRSSSSFNLLPIRRSPAVVNGALHWIMHSDLKKKGPNSSCGNNGIIVFRMDNEQLFAKPHPGSHVCNAKVQNHTMMTLLVNNQNCLFFCHLLRSEHAVDIWMLEDYEMWAWNKRYKVELIPYYSWEYSWPIVLDMSLWMHLIYIQDGHLVFLACGRLFFYDLDHKTVKGFQLPENIMLHPYDGSYIKTMLAIA